MCWLVPTESRVLKRAAKIAGLPADRIPERLRVTALPRGEITDVKAALPCRVEAALRLRACPSGPANARTPTLVLSRLDGVREDLQNTVHRNSDPVRTVVQFVAHLVHRFFDQKDP